MQFINQIAGFEAFNLRTTPPLFWSYLGTIRKLNRKTYVVCVYVVCVCTWVRAFERSIYFYKSITKLACLKKR